MVLSDVRLAADCEICRAIVNICARTRQGTYSCHEQFKLRSGRIVLRYEMWQHALAMANYVYHYSQARRRWPSTTVVLGLRTTTNVQLLYLCIGCAAHSSEYTLIILCITSQAKIYNNTLCDWRLPNWPLGLAEQEHVDFPCCRLLQATLLGRTLLLRHPGLLVLIQ